MFVDDKVTIILVHVDDIILTGNDSTYLKKLTSLLYTFLLSKILVISFFSWNLDLNIWSQHSLQLTYLEVKSWVPKALHLFTRFGF